MSVRFPWAGVGLMLGCLWPVSPLWAEPCAPPPLPITELSAEAAVRYAVPCSAAVVEADAALLEARGRLAQSRLLLNNPEFQASADVGGGQTTAQLLQPISLTGAGRHTVRAAEAQVEAAQLQRARAALETAAAVRLAWAEVGVATATRALAEEASALTTRLSAAVALKLAAGEASNLDLHLARLSEAEMAAWLLEAQRAEAEALRALSAWVGAPLSVGLVASDPILAAPPPSLKTTARERLDVRARQADVQVAQAEAGLARAYALPPLSLGVFWQLDPAGTLIGPSISMPLPVFDRNQQARAAAQGEVDRAQAAAQTTTARASAEIDTARTRLEQAELAFAHLQGPLLDDARAALASISLGFEGGELDLPTALLLQRQVLLSESAAIRARGQVAGARVDYALASEDPSLFGGGSR